MHNPHLQFGLSSPPITNFDIYESNILREAQQEVENNQMLLNASSLPVQCGDPIVWQFVDYECYHQRITKETELKMLVENSKRVSKKILQITQNDEYTEIHCNAKQHYTTNKSGTCQKQSTK